MKYRPRWALLAAGALVVIALFTYPSWRGFFTTTGGGGVDYANASEAQKEVYSQMRRTPGANPATAYAYSQTIVPAPTSDYPTPDNASLQAVKIGQFVEIDAVHTATGRATIYRRSDNSLTLRFDDFAVTNGPGLVVILSTNSAPKTAAEVEAGPFFRVGDLKGSKGNQNYDIPAELKLERYKSVVIFSEPLKTVYSFATLN
jgi:hypothetical protein